MNENEHKQNLQEEIDHINFHRDHKFHWKRIHHTWGFWVGMALIFVAIMYYIVSVDFAFAPRRQLKQTEKTTTP